ncbi:MAG: TetM/TetW/TetO/TetS family tetracycline resistance ribosomal protection protein [Ruminiclostridium sp.]|nr:TetM/TetW/TetO/TetS family tetracycline resistance ribosomal protection protein [Ruminiclostridium sp.]
MKRLGIGIMAHVDAGKTTLTEAMMYLTGNIRKLGRVDHGDAFLDTHILEKSRGITIFSKQAVMNTDDAEITLLDTPGHTDFSSEAERALQIMDYAVLIISGTDGVQNHTETLWHLLKSYRVPTFIFVNKMDISELSKNLIMAELVRRLDNSCVDFSGVIKNGIDEDTAEAIALCDEAIMNELLERGEISTDIISNKIKQRKIFPCFFGSALKLNGVEEFIKLLSEYTLQPKYNDEFSATVYKISEDEHGNRLTHLKVTGGTLKVKSIIEKGDNLEKINSIRIYSGGKFRTVDEAPAGTVCAVTGLSDTYSGQGLGISADAPLPLLEPLFNYRIILPSHIDVYNGLNILRKLEQEDPTLRIVWNEQLKEIHLQLMGEIQLEILKSVIHDRFGFDVEFSEGSISYKETIESAVYGIGHYEPLRHYAEVRLLLEPAEEGLGLRFVSECREDKLDKNWQRLILTHLNEKKHLGVLTGSPITDMKITLVSGRAHLKHTEGGDFRQATYRAVRQGLMSAKSILLEPYYSFTLTVPSDCVGRAMTDLQMKNAEFSSPETAGENEMLIKGTAPASKLRGYQSVISSYTGGKGRLICIPDGYRPCTDSENVIKEIGYNPESDLDNPADSVFCSHGAGFNVSWEQVPSYAHTIAENEKSEDTEAQTRPVNQYKAKQASDKELMEIFERTYGKINRDERSAMRRLPEKKDKPYKAKERPKGPLYLLVDGYNIIFAWEELNKIAQQNLDLARSELINILCNYQGYNRCEVIVVFDAYKVKGNKGEVERHGGITAVYTKEAETADMYIEKATRMLGKKHRVRVATSDRLEQLIIFGADAERVSASELYAEVKYTEKQIQAFLDNQT